MRKILALFVIALLLRFSYKLLTNTHQTNSSQTRATYTVKTGARDAMPGEDIRVYDKAGKEILSLVSEDPQYVYALVGDSLIVDIGTSASQRIFAIYDIPSQNKIFQSTYYPSENNSLAINNASIQFYYKIWNEYEGKDTRPSDAPNCTGLDNGYVETRSFDLTDKKMTSSGKFTCAYFE